MNEFKLINDLSNVASVKADAEALDLAKRFFNDVLNAVESDMDNIRTHIPKLRAEVNHASNILSLIAVVLDMAEVFDDLDALDMREDWK